MAPSTLTAPLLDTTPPEYMVRLERGHARRARERAANLRAGRDALCSPHALGDGWERWAEHYAALSEAAALRHDAKADELEASMGWPVERVA